MARAFVAVGSNIEPESNVRRAISLLSKHVRVLAISTVYSTAPVGRPEQERYWNCVAEIETALPPMELKHVLRGIEQELGRERVADEYAPRTIDLDPIVYGEVVMEAAELTLPDPEITTRPFLAIPLRELAPELRLPGSELPISEVAAAMPRADLRPLVPYTERIRREAMDERRAS